MYDLITFADHKVALARTVVQVIDIQSLRLAFPDKVNGYDGLQPMTKVLARKGILALVHHGHVNGIDLFLDRALLALLRILLNAHQHIGFLQVFHVVLGRMLRLEMEQISQVSSDDNGRRYVQEVMGKVLKCSLVGNLVSLLDVAFQNVVHQ